VHKVSVRGAEKVHSVMFESRGHLDKEATEGGRAVLRRHLASLETEEVPA
jgi:hypothetical protein